MLDFCSEREFGFILFQTYPSEEITVLNLQVLRGEAFSRVVDLTDLVMGESGKRQPEV